LLAPVRWVMARFFEPDNGALVRTPSIDDQDQSMPLSSSYRISP
jgi:hypothetical protein